MTITECIEQRRSIRKYTEQEVEREKIEEVLRAAKGQLFPTLS